MLAICGPTSSGKSEIAMRVAQAIGGEIINADSRQVYAHMPIGTGWPKPEQLARVPHHGFGIVEPNERYSAGCFVDGARALIEQIRRRGRVPIVVGGTGLYIEALSGTMPLDRARGDEALRARVHGEAAIHSHEFLTEWLRCIAPSAAARIRPRDRYRTLRALEEALALRGDPPEQWSGRASARPTGGLPRQARPPQLERGVAMRTFVLQVQREKLRARIEQRVRRMFAAGLVEEAARAAARFGDRAPALTGLGYGEALALYRGLATRAEAIAAAVRHTTQYAKRQQTWFRRMRGTIAIDADDVDRAVAAIRNAAVDLWVDRPRGKGKREAGVNSSRR